MKERKRDVKVEKLRITEETKEERERFSVIKKLRVESVCLRWRLGDVIGSSGTSVQKLIDNAT